MVQQAVAALEDPQIVLGAAHDAVLALSPVRLPGGMALVTGGRDGLVKVWK
jgi:hypothetical protein